MNQMYTILMGLGNNDEQIYRSLQFTYTFVRLKLQNHNSQACNNFPTQFVFSDNQIVHCHDYLYEYVMKS